MTRNLLSLSSPVLKICVSSFMCVSSVSFFIIHLNFCSMCFLPFSVYFFQIDYIYYTSMPAYVCLVVILAFNKPRVETIYHILLVRSLQNLVLFSLCNHSVFVSPCAQQMNGGQPLSVTGKRQASLYFQKLIMV